VVSLCVIEGWFHFPPHLSSATTLPWEITEHKKWRKHLAGLSAIAGLLCLIHVTTRMKKTDCAADTPGAWRCLAPLYDVVQRLR